MPERLKVFVCHASEDRADATELAKTMQAAGFDVWLDAASLIPGDEWESEIRSAIRSSDVAVVLISAHVHEKVGFLQREIRMVLEAADERPEGQSFVIPVRLDDSDVPDRLRKWHCADLRTPGTPNKLLEALRINAEKLSRVVDDRTLLVDATAFGESFFRIRIPDDAVAQDLIDQVHFRLTPLINRDSYGSEWAFVDIDGKPYSAMGNKWAASRGSSVDLRPLKEIGIASGMRLYINNLDPLPEARTLADRLIFITKSLTEAGIPFAFGGAIALAYWGREPRGTRDIDLNVFLETSELEPLFEWLDGVAWLTGELRQKLVADGQARIWWGDTPIDIFVNTVELHREAATQLSFVPFAGTTIPILPSHVLAAMKAVFGREKDWRDIRAMNDAQTITLGGVEEVLVRLLGPASPEIAKLHDELAS